MPDDVRRGKDMFNGKTLTALGAIAFDLDDTLFDAGTWTVEALRYAAVLRGMRPECVDRAIDEYLLGGSPHDAGFYNAILSGCSQSDTGLNIRALHEAALAYRGQGREWEPYPGVREALVELSWGFKIAIVADGPVEAQRAKLDALGLEPLIDLVVFSDEIEGLRSRRPDARPYRRLQEGLGLSAAQIMFVGDHPVKDFKTARLLGFPTCRVFTGPHRQQPYPDASFCALKELTSVARLPDLLREIQQRQSAQLASQMAFLKPAEDTLQPSPTAVPRPNWLPARSLDETISAAPLSASVVAPEQAQREVFAAAPAEHDWAPGSLDATEPRDTFEEVSAGSYASPATLRESLVLLPEPVELISCNPQPPPRAAVYASMQERLLRRHPLISSPLLNDSPLD